MLLDIVGAVLLKNWPTWRLTGKSSEASLDMDRLFLAAHNDEFETIVGCAKLLAIRGEETIRKPELN